MDGAFLSTRLPPIGPAVAQLPSRSHTLRVPVAALAVSVPAGTEVERLKLASAGLARPEPLSLAVQAMLTSFACHWPSAVPQLIAGAVVSGVYAGAQAGRPASVGEQVQARPVHVHDPQAARRVTVLVGRRVEDNGLAVGRDAEVADAEGPGSKHLTEAVRGNVILVDRAVGADRVQ